MLLTVELNRETPPIDWGRLCKLSETQWLKKSKT